MTSVRNPDAKDGDRPDAPAASAPDAGRSAPVMLITGGSRGIGAATVRLAARRGYDVAFSYLSNEAAARDLVAAIEMEGRSAIAVRANSAVPAEVSRMFDRIDRRFSRLVVLVNNAAMIARQSRLEDLDYERVRRVFSVNAIGPILCAQQAVKRMSHRHGGRGGAVVNVSSLRPPRQPQRLRGLRVLEGRGRDHDDRLREGGRA